MVTSSVWDGYRVWCYMITTRLNKLANTLTGFEGISKKKDMGDKITV